MYVFIVWFLGCGCFGGVVYLKFGVATDLGGPDASEASSDSARSEAGTMAAADLSPARGGLRLSSAAG